MAAPSEALFCPFPVELPIDSCIAGGEKFSRRGIIPSSIISEALLFVLLPVGAQKYSYLITWTPSKHPDNEVHQLLD